MKLVKELFRGTYPAQLFAVLVSFLGSLINGLIVGNALPSVAMVAVGFVAPVCMILSALSALFSGGSRVLCGRYLGVGDTENINVTFTICIKAAFAVGLVLTVLCLIFSTPVSTLLGAGGDNLSYTSSYLRGISTGMIFALVLPCLMVFLQMGNDAKFALLLAGVLVAVNAVLALVLVNVVKLGVFGAGLATSLSQFVATVVGVIRFRKKDGLMHLTKDKGTDAIFKPMLILGFPGAVINITYSLRNIILNKFALSIAGEEAVGALAILGSCGGMFDAFNIAMGTTILMLASLAVGERDKEFIRNISKYCAKAGLIIGFAKVLVLAVLGRPIAMLFGASGLRLDLAQQLLLLYSFSMPLNMLALNITNIYVTLGRTKDVNALNLLTSIVAPLGFVIIFKGLLGINAIWLCYSMAEVITLFVMFVLYFVRKKRFPHPLTDILMLDDMLPSSDSLKLNFHTLNELSSVSEQATDFCKASGIDGKRSLLCGLCIEEMGRNIIEINFPKSKRKGHMIEAFVLCEDGNILLRIRDDGPNYNIDEVNTIFNPEDPLANIGLRIAAGSSKEMAYHTPLGMNVLTLKM